MALQCHTWHCHCMGFALLSSPVLPKTGGGEKEMKKKNTPCLPLLFPFATSAVGCQLPVFVPLHPLQFVHVRGVQK